MSDLQGVGGSMVVSVGLISIAINIYLGHQVMNGGSLGRLIDIPAFVESKESGGGTFKKLGGFKRGEDQAAFADVSHDKVRSYWDSRPCNSGWKFDGIEYGSKRHWEEVTRRKYHVEYHIPSFAEFDKWRGKKVLEIGGGICTTATSFAKAGANITVVELSPKSMEHCKQRFEAMGLTAHFVIANAEELSDSLPLQTYDLVWSFGVIHHSPSPEKILQQIRRYMAPHSRLKLMVYAKISFKLFWILNHTNQWDFSAMDEVVAHYSEAQEGSPVTYTYSILSFRRLLQDFKVSFMGKTHIFPYSIRDYHQNKYIVDPLFKHISSGRWAELEEELGWHLLAEATLPELEGAYADQAPLSQCTVAEFPDHYPQMRGILPGPIKEQ